jgi:glycosyltransferase involved in cell wall biosynthesis
MRDGKPCELCLEKQSEWNCLRHNCENSLIKSAGYALRNAYARLTNAYKKNVDAYVCITDFQRQKLTAAGYDKNKLFVIPNSLDAPDRCEYQQGNYVAYCGRISTEKGIDLLFEVARRHPDIPFHLAGYVRDTELTTTLPSNCLLLGYLNQNELKDFYTNASFFVMASKWYEGFPMTVLEAAGFGKPTVAPNHGGFTDIVGEGDDATGKLFAPGDVNDLERKIIDLWNNPAEVERLGEKSFRKLKAKYDSEVVYSEWERLIRQILLHRKTQ